MFFFFFRSTYKENETKQIYINRVRVGFVEYRIMGEWRRKIKTKKKKKIRLIDIKEREENKVGDAEKYKE